MTTYTDVDSLQQHYTEVFDFYLEERSLPPGTDNSDTLLEPLTEIADDYRDMAHSDEERGQAIRSAASAVMGTLIEEFAALDQQAAGELELIDRFEKASLEGKRRLWQQVKNTIEHGYSVLEVNLPGYIKQFATDDREAVFAALIGDWRDALMAKLEQLRHTIISTRKQQIKMDVGRLALHDIEMRRQVAALVARYPVIDELAREIGRARKSRTEVFDSVIYRFLPSSVSSNCGGKEIDSIVTGADISRVIPAELSLPDKIFDHKYVSHQLQQFDSQIDRTPRRTPLHHPTPRLSRGPVIVAVDTSASMNGRPLEVAFAAVKQLVSIVLAEHRACFLISFSVRAMTIDLSSPRNRYRLDSFLNSHYTGGTSGEQMLSKAIDTLRTDKYEMADVLIISDMEFALPSMHTRMAMANEQASGTRFHALQIGSFPHEYSSILNKIWSINLRAT